MSDDNKQVVFKLGLDVDEDSVQKVERVQKAIAQLSKDVASVPDVKSMVGGIASSMIVPGASMGGGMAPGSYASAMAQAGSSHVAGSLSASYGMPSAVSSLTNSSMAAVTAAGSMSGTMAGYHPMQLTMGPMAPYTPPRLHFGEIPIDKSLSPAEHSKKVDDLTEGIGDSVAKAMENMKGSSKATESKEATAKNAHLEEINKKIEEGKKSQFGAFFGSTAEGKKLLDEKGKAEGEAEEKTKKNEELKKSAGEAGEAIMKLAKSAAYLTAGGAESAEALERIVVKFEGFKNGVQGLMGSFTSVGEYMTARGGEGSRMGRAGAFLTKNAHMLGLAGTAIGAGVMAHDHMSDPKNWLSMRDTIHENTGLSKEISNAAMGLAEAAWDWSPHRIIHKLMGANINDTGDDRSIVERQEANEQEERQQRQREIKMKVKFSDRKLEERAASAKIEASSKGRIEQGRFETYMGTTAAEERDRKDFDRDFVSRNNSRQLGAMEADHGNVTDISKLDESREAMRAKRKEIDDSALEGVSQSFVPSSDLARKSENNDIEMIEAKGRLKKYETRQDEMDNSTRNVDYQGDVDKIKVSYMSAEQKDDGNENIRRTKEEIVNLEREQGMLAKERNQQEEGSLKKQISDTQSIMEMHQQGINSAKRDIGSNEAKVGRMSARQVAFANSGHAKIQRYKQLKKEGKHDEAELELDSINHEEIDAFIGTGGKEQKEEGELVYRAKGKRVGLAFNPNSGEERDQKEHEEKLKSAGETLDDQRKKQTAVRAAGDASGKDIKASLDGKLTVTLSDNRTVEVKVTSNDAVVKRAYDMVIAEMRKGDAEIIKYIETKLGQDKNKATEQITAGKVAKTTAAGTSYPGIP